MDKSSQSKLAQVHPALAERVANLIAAFASRGIDVRVVSGLRTYAEQDALYRKGRTVQGKIVTNAKGGRSNHNFGLACDLGIFDAAGKYLPESPLYNLIQSAAHTAKLESGADWKHINDRPHVQLPSDLILGGSPTNACRALYAKGGLPAVFAHVTAHLDSAAGPAVASPVLDSTHSKEAPKSEAQSQPPILKRGDKGKLVEELQQALVEHGARIKADGDFGPATDRAVRVFQAARHLAADGKVGDRTREALGI